MEDPQDLERLLNEVFKERDIDFLHYRENLIERRIATRLRATRCLTYPDYIHFLKGNREEMDALLDALTIHTTQFFRDIRVFEVIKEKIIPQLFTSGVLEKRKTVRLWSCGASGGEEATTMLILACEYLKENIDQTQFYVYGTDIDRWSIEKAKDGVYEEYEFKDMPQELIDKYFVAMGNRRYWRKKELNKYLFFRQQDVIRDEPVKSVDMILCRNMFIYFKRELQDWCLKKFYNALNKDGFLVLGLTESLGSAFSGRFAEVDRQNRIYRKI